MSNVKRSILFTAMIIFISAGSSCISTSSYGTLGSIPIGRGSITFEKLKERFQDYHTYWSGTQQTNVIAYLFDPKDDDRTIQTHEWWVSVESGEEIKGLWIFEQDPMGHLPEVYSIMGPGNELYGYLYTSWYHVWDDINIIKVDEKTLWIDFVPVPDFREYIFQEFTRELLSFIKAEATFRFPARSCFKTT